MHSLKELNFINFKQLPELEEFYAYFKRSIKKKHVYIITSGFYAQDVLKYVLKNKTQYKGKVFRMLIFSYERELNEKLMKT